MTELQLLVKAAVDDLGTGPLVLADWLQEHDREREAALLRKRWKTWRKWHAEMDARVAGTAYPPATNEQLLPVRTYCDNQFRAYIRERFGTQVTDCKRWVHRQGIAHAVPSQTSEERYLRACCGLLVYEFEVRTSFGRRICRQCCKKLPELMGA